MTETTATTDRRKLTPNQPGPGDAVYALGLIGALVFFVKRADTVGGYLLAVLKALVWPAFLVHEAFRRLSG